MGRRLAERVQVSFEQRPGNWVVERIAVSTTISFDNPLDKLIGK